MISSNYTTTSYGYGNATPVSTAHESNRAEKAAEEQREVYSTSLLAKLDQRGYDAFLNATDHLSKADARLAAQTLEHTAALSAANEYATAHDIGMTKDLSLVYAFFENYQDVVTSDQIKHLLNTRLMSSPEVKTETFDSEEFFDDYMNQLGGKRALDIRV